MSSYSARQVYRSWPRSIGIALVLVIDVALAVEGGIRGRSHSTAGFAVGAALLLLVGVPIARSAAAVLVLDQHTVFIRNPFRTLSIPRADIETFKLGRFGLLGCVCLVSRKDGSAIPAFAIQGITGQPRRRTSVSAQRVVEELNRQLAA